MHFLLELQEQVEGSGQVSEETNTEIGINQRQCKDTFQGVQKGKFVEELRLTVLGMTDTIAEVSLQ